MLRGQFRIPIPLPGTAAGAEARRGNPEDGRPENQRPQAPLQTSHFKLDTFQHVIAREARQSEPTTDYRLPTTDSSWLGRVGKKIKEVRPGTTAPKYAKVV
jgi:hypothetical protein